MGLVCTTPFAAGGCSGGPVNFAGIIQGGGQALQGASLGEKDELAIGESAVCAITSRYPLSTDEKLNKYVNLVGMAVASACPRDDLQFSFGVLDTDAVNAYSTPGGFVLVTRGALMRMDDEAELAGVLAHEIGHVVLGHGLAVAKNSMTTGGLAKTAQSAGVGKPLEQLGLGVDGLTDKLLAQGWEQPQEFAADDEAVHYLVRANYDAAGFERFLRKLESGGGSLMSTHPAKRDRVAKVSALVQQLSSGRGGQTLKQRFAQNVRKV
jgi:predicted Zn-dependent protease